MINPKPEHRLTFLEKQFVAMGGHLEGIQEDIEKLEEGMMSSFKELGGYFELTEKAMATKDDLATMATKQDISTLETRLGKIEDTQEQILKLLQQRSGE